MSLNETNTTSDLITALTGLGIAHLRLVCVPSLMLGTFVLILICKLMSKNKKISATLLLYLIVICTCMLGPSSYGILWDISLITGIPVMGKCSSYPSNIFCILAFCVFQMLLSCLIGLIALIQLITVKYEKTVTPKATFAALCAVMLMSTAILKKIQQKYKDHCA